MQTNTLLRGILRQGFPLNYAGNVISTERLIHAWLMDGSRTVPAGSQAHLKNCSTEKEGKTRSANSVLPHFAVYSYLWRWAALETPAWFGATTFLHLPVHGSDLTSQKCKQHHTSPEQAMTSSSIRAMSYQAKKPPTVPRTYTKPGDHLSVA